MYPDLSKKIETGLTTPKFCSIPSPSFIDSWKEIKNDNLSDRRLYYYLLNIENFFPILSCAWEKATAVLYKVQDYSLNSENSLFSRKNGIFSLKNSSELNFFRESVQHFFPVNFDTRDEPDFLFYIINHYSPFALIDGSWLSGAVSLAHAHYRYGGTLLKIHSKKVGNGSLENNHSLAFRQMARNIKLDFFPIFSWEYAFEQSRSNYAYTLPVFLLSLSQFPGLLMPEILGVNLLLSLFDVPLFSNLVETSLTSIDKNFLHMKRNYQCEYINLSIDAITEYISFISDSCDVEIFVIELTMLFLKHL